MDDVMKAAKPVAKNEKLEQMMGRLSALTARQNAAAKDGTGTIETVADDVALQEKQKTLIAEQEAVVRPIMALFGVDYDSLISMNPTHGRSDGKPSMYAQAVQARPELLVELLNSGQPVLAALKVALSFKPFADFGEKYGNTPESIKAKIRDEVLNELGMADPAIQSGNKNLPEAAPNGRGAATPAGGEPSAPAPMVAVGGGSVFAKVSGQRMAPKKRTGGLADVFGR